MKFPTESMSETDNVSEVVFTTPMRQKMTGSPLASLSPGTNGLKTSTSTLTGNFVLEHYRC